MTIIITPRARKQIAKASRWWLGNRDKAPEAFDEDLDAGLEMLADSPLAGEPFRSRPGVRRLVLRRIRYYLYYRIVRGDLYVLSLWHTSRRPPRL